MKLFIQFVKNSASLETFYVLYKNYLQSLQLKNPAKKISNTKSLLNFMPLEGRTIPLRIAFSSSEIPKESKLAPQSL